MNLSQFLGTLPVDGTPLNLSRRRFVGASLGALVLGALLPAPVLRAAEAATVKPGTRLPAFLEIRADGSALLRSPFVEGGQGIYTALAQIVGEELDIAPERFSVECAPPGPDYLLVNGARFTGGSFSVRSSIEVMRRLGASARQMLLQVAAAKLDVPLASLDTRPGEVVHPASGRTLGYGELATLAAALPPPAEVKLRDRKDFRWIGQPVKRLDARDKATGKVAYTIDLTLDGMLLAAVQHAPRMGMEPEALANEAEVKAMPGVHSVHRLPGAVAVVAQRWWQARRAVESLRVSWREAPAGTAHAMPADFSSAAFRERLAATPGPGVVAEQSGQPDAQFGPQATVIEATYDAPYLAHGQLEPPSTLARYNADGTLELWLPNQAPEMFQQAVAKVAGLPPEKVILHSPPLGGFFGRHFLYGTANPFTQAILLAKAVKAPIKLIWTREEEFLRDAFRPMGVTRLRATLDAQGLPHALVAETMGESATERWFGRVQGKANDNAVEGLAGKVYAIPHRRVSQVYVEHPPTLGFWRSVGHSMNDFFYESFLDELADAGQQDPYALRLHLLAEQPRHKTLLEAVAALSGGWKRGPFTAADGSRRARGVAMASPFGSEVATIAEVSIEQGQIVVHDVWVAFDPGSIVNPAIVEAQVKSAVALGLSSALLEEVVYESGQPRARNFGAYAVLPQARMPRVHVRIVESGAPMGGVGEPGLPGVPPAVANAVASLTGQRLRSLPLSRARFADA
ncbi:xanthine dehydrogenase family protein molybdopterin-binding subunit [Pseudomonas otitidis]|uniref:xanthine dehydrogenase family protein molybdopterin-binding subunit n=1 Tax=Metapseudomonas otitidis TaxID=319939 RepID=UPI00244783EE|nr:xanthine dehydrogenase family protein molybdopterin-binding subunit [Pseudomonas otitidis]MDH1105440.1 xanthine dehydrogenase family protein molybdopterin-binding subunit [Pseudomonas otitidis]MDH1159683.1 xanthine dehydrogenase family protein molybdopterin-binding subunit [Pseudomonas otitidis]MDH1162484.1 xanthine dehydrogenase family protein molybdopterin-binding subunit [Pseudomonas otitidis]